MITQTFTSDCVPRDSPTTTYVMLWPVVSTTESVMLLFRSVMPWSAMTRRTATMYFDRCMAYSYLSNYKKVVHCNRRILFVIPWSQTVSRCFAGDWCRYRADGFTKTTRNGCDFSSNKSLDVAYNFTLFLILFCLFDYFKISGFFRTFCFP